MAVELHYRGRGVRLAPPRRFKENSDDHLIQDGSIVCRRARAGTAGRRRRANGGASQRRLIEWQLRLVEFGIVGFRGTVQLERAQFLVLGWIEQLACPSAKPNP